MAADGLKLGSLKLDGGMARNHLLMQRLADVRGIRILRSHNAESTAFGAAGLAGLGCEMYRSLADIAAMGRPEVRFEPGSNESQRNDEIAGWNRAESSQVALAVNCASLPPRAFARYGCSARNSHSPRCGHVLVRRATAVRNRSPPTGRFLQ